MKKKLIAVIVLAVTCIIAVTSYLFYGQATAELASNKSREIQQDDFILHIRVERMNEGFQVFRAIQYVGDEQVEIKHQTPLISISFKHQNHDYTGSSVLNTLHTGNSYHPQNAKSFDSPEEGQYLLFCEARFLVNGEQMTISHQEELVFE
ncbi:hypothetical protein [Lentibacillus sp. CBA3610]|uniref:hypothetical protein n=1 Tax=Lentibacillus sp. CBA3610 TaxID=2518176 RepID=UPI001595C519|nr:hypothetical protein [Lentibacillus sp. CBA3610]QKY68881.1 hypothetical protein Len3610_03935 [Lentibacillus sp. CBA3610]